MLYSESLLVGTIKERLGRVKEKLKKVRLLFEAEPEKSLSVLGVKKHRFLLAPPLAEVEAETFEKTHQISLPEDYRSFLLTLGATGAGPYYGLLPLSKWNDVSFDDPHEALLQSDCKLVPNMSKDWQCTLLKQGLEPYGGALPIVEQGCTYYSLLVLNGPYHGKVVNIDLNGSPPFFVDNPDFLSWYERWLDEWLNGVEIFWFGFTPTGDEEELCLLLQGEKAVAAALALNRLPRLGSKTVSLLEHSLASPAADVRAAAVKTIGHLGGENKLEQVIALVDDPSPLVRHDALWTLRKYFMDEKKAISPLFTKALEDSDEEVLHYALMTFKELPFTDKEELVRFLQDPREKIKAMAKWVLQGYEK